MTQEPKKKAASPTRVWALILFVIALGFVVITVLDTNYRALGIGRTPYHLIRAGLILVDGLVVANLLKARVRARSQSSFTARQQTIVGFTSRLIFYLGLTLAVLAALGVGVSSFVFGGAFVTVIIGLAGQSMFANILGGVWLVMFHPFQIGDEISFVTWQYPVLMPSYPHEPLKPVYSGRVTDINLMYTSLTLDDGDPMVFPNGIIAQSAIANKSQSGFRRIRTRFDVPNAIDPKQLFTALETKFKEIDRSPQLELADLTQTSYSVRITIWSGEAEEAVRHRVLAYAWEAVDDLQRT
jgi:small-conductance mechanosensitive channel